MSYTEGYRQLRKRRAKRFFSTKYIRSEDRKYMETAGRIRLLKEISKERELTLAEGRELNSLGKKLRRLQKKTNGEYHHDY